jgi:MFS family permease
MQPSSEVRKPPADPQLITRRSTLTIPVKDDLNLKGTDYSWLSSVFYFGWLAWAIPSNLLMQRSPPTYYLGFNIFMWGVLLMCQATVKNFGALAALRVLGGCFESIADPAFMLMYVEEEHKGG